MYKVNKWLVEFPGDNEEAAQMYLFKTFVEEVNKEPTIDETNALMVRKAYSMVQNSPFDVFDCVMISVLVTSRDGFNDLELDVDFSTQFAQFSSLDDIEKEDFITLCQFRMRVRLHLARLIIVLDR